MHERLLRCKRISRKSHIIFFFYTEKVTIDFFNAIRAVDVNAHKTYEQYVNHKIVPSTGGGGLSADHGIEDTSMLREGDRAMFPGRI